MGAKGKAHNDQQEVAQILAEWQIYRDDDYVCEKHNICDRTLRRYKARLLEDTELSGIVRKLRKELGHDWIDECNESLRQTFRRVRDLIPEATIRDIPALTAFLKVAGELSVSSRMLFEDVEFSVNESDRPVSLTEAAARLN